MTKRTMPATNFFALSSRGVYRIIRFGLARGNASLVDMQVDGRWKDSRLPSYYASAEIAKNSATAWIKYGKSR